MNEILQFSISNITFSNASQHPTTKRPSRRNVKLRIHSAYTKETYSSLTESSKPQRDISLPQHIAVIMDGNARWAAKHNKPSFAGHTAGVESLRRLVKYCRKLEHIKALTVFALSTENQQRGRQELGFLLTLIERVLQEEIEELCSAGVRLHFIGDHSTLPSSLVHEMEKAATVTQQNSDLHLTVALNYGSRHDITTTVKDIIQKVQRGEIDEKDINEDLISSSLSLACVPSSWRHPDLVIRTSGEQRLSNFLLWESAYSELYFSDVYWPDFREEHFDEALAAYAVRERRFGRRNDSDSD